MRRKKEYFPRVPEDPAPVNIAVNRRVAFSDVDAMGVLWHGRYSFYFEQANEELGRECGMTYRDFMREKLRAPIIQFHVDYFASPMLGEETTVVARFIWNEGARMNIEYELRKEDETLAATGFTVQMFITDAGETLLASPNMLEVCRQRWFDGDFANLQVTEG